MENKKNKNPQIYDRTKDCLRFLFLREMKNGIRPIHARNDILNEEKLSDRRMLDRSSKIMFFIWALDCFTSFAMT
jgi:hypothetical protein